MIDRHPKVGGGDCGWADIEPDAPVEAGSIGTWKITYHVGHRGVDDGGVVKFAWRDVSDWGTPQFEDPAAPEFASVTTTGPARLRAAFERQRYVRPWRLCVTVDVFDDSLAKGDEITLTLGDRSGGGIGSRAQTFCCESFDFRVAADWAGTWVYTNVPSPAFPVVSGPAHHLVVVSPSESVAGQPLWIGVKAEDVWGNPCTDYTGEVQLDSAGLQGLPDRYHFVETDRGVRRFENVVAPEPGCYRAAVAEVGGPLTATGNLLTCRKNADKFVPFWGDLHGQSGETVGTNPVSSYFRFARDAAWLDFAGHQGNDFQITEAIWDEIRSQANGHNEDHRFVAFVGYEWSGNTPVGGDRNVYYPGDDGPLLHSSQVLIPQPAGQDHPHVEDLYAALKDREALVVPHVGGRYADLRWHDAELEPLIEVYSEWGEFEWFLREALQRGYKVGFTAGSDDHKGRPGAAYPGGGSFGVYGGLTCVWAGELTRAGIWEGLKARRCYGTTGQRIGLRVQVDGHPMGAEFCTSGSPRIEVQVAGSGSLERIDLFRGLELIHTAPEPVVRKKNSIRVAWSGQRIRARNRLVRWDGGITLTGGRIIGAAGYAFDSPAEGIEQFDEYSVAWKSVTTGDADGLILDLEAAAEGVLQFETEVVSHTVTVAEIAAGPVEIDAGGIDMKVRFECEPVGLGETAEVSHRDVDPPFGCHPYWVRVTQTDGGRAWASPVYVTRTRKTRV